MNETQRDLDPFHDFQIIIVPGTIAFSRAVFEPLLITREGRKVWADSKLATSFFPRLNKWNGSDLINGLEERHIYPGWDAPSIPSPGQPTGALSSLSLSLGVNGFKEHALTRHCFNCVFQTLVLRRGDKRRNIPVPLYTTATRHETARSRRPITRACIHATPNVTISSTASRTSESIFISTSSMSRVWCRKCVIRINIFLLLLFRLKMYFVLDRKWFVQSGRFEKNRIKGDGYIKNRVESYLSEKGGLSGGILYSSYKRSLLPYLLDTHTHAHKEKILPLSIIMSPKRKGACNHLDNTISAEVVE